ncbi:restriction endonuclease subunit S [Paracoccus sp. (in: a-proteobacteria)]|uniref:restriction endonuclease subunit S n=1 Tax=Paracoccus sp. TaxID=267 RepID=UPI002B001AF8|nr:restriction endonuclease subunit S [Paracoccus sp. (in: a-proteobacteria)]
MTGLPQGWVSARLDEVTTPRGEKADPVSLGDLPFLGMDHIEAHTANLLGSQPVGELKSAVAVFKSGDLLYGRLRPYLNKVHLAEFDGAASAEFIVFPPQPAIEQRFLQCVLRSPDYRTVADQRSTGDRPRVKFENVGDYEIPLPPLPEQRRIVRKLDTLSARTTTARNHLTTIGKLVERYKSGVLRMAFRGDLTADYRKSSSFLSPIEFDLSSVELRKLKLENHRLPTDKTPYQVPASWRWIALPALGELARGKSKHRPRNDKVLFGGHYPFIQTGDVSNSNGRIKKYSATYSNLGLSQSRLWPAGTLCITIAANIAETGILEFDSCFPDSIVGFMADEGKTSALFIEYFIRTVRADLEAFAPGVAQKNINLNTLSGVFVPMPPLPEQCEIVRRIETAFAKVDRLAAEAAKALKLLGRLDQRILAKAFAGELVPQDPTDEPAEALLARIREARAAASKPKHGRKASA